MSMPIASTPLSDDRRATDQVWNWLMTAPFSVSKLPEPLIRELVAVSTRICSDQFRETHAELSRIPEFRHYQVSPSEQVITRLTHQPSPAALPHRPDHAQESEPDHPTQAQDAAQSQPEQDQSAAESGETTPTPIKTLNDIWHAPQELTQLMNGELDHLPLDEWRVQMRAMVRRMTAGRSRTSEMTQATEAAEVALEVQRFMRQEGPTTLGELGLKSGQMPIVQAMLQIRSDNIKGFVNRQVSVNFSPSAICDAFIALVMMAPGTSLDGHPLTGQRINLNEVVIQPEPPAQQDAVLMRRILQVRSLLNQHFTNSYNALQSLGKHQGRTAIQLKDAIEHIWYTRNHTGTSLPTAKEVDGVELIMQRWIREQAERSSTDLTPIVGRVRPQQNAQNHKTPVPERPAGTPQADSATTTATATATAQTTVTEHLTERDSQTLSTTPTPVPPAPMQTGGVNFGAILQRHLNTMRSAAPQTVVTPVSSQAGLELIAQRLDTSQPTDTQLHISGDSAATPLHGTDSEPSRHTGPEATPAAQQPDPMLAFLVPGLFGTPGQVAPAQTGPAAPAARKDRKANNPRRPTMVTIRSGNHSGPTEAQHAPTIKPADEASAAPVSFSPSPSLPEISAEERQAISDRREAAKAIIHEMETHFDLEALQVRLRAEQLIAEGSEGQRVFKLWRNGSLVPSEDELMLLRLAGDIIRDESLALQELAREAELNEDLFGTEEEESDTAFEYDPDAPTTRRKREEYILRMLDEHGPLTYNKLCRRLGIRAGKMIEITRQIPSIVCQKGVIQRRER